MQFRFTLLLAALMTLASCSRAPHDVVDATATPVESAPLECATQFSVERFSDGTALVHVADGRDYALVPRGKTPVVPVVRDAKRVDVPIENIFLSATSAMDLFSSLDALGAVACCASRPDDFAIPEVRDALSSGAIRYVGKYSAPDYETLLSCGSQLAIESTMIGHVPKTLEQLERLGLTVFIERSNYEPEPLGRLEWIKLYGMMLGKEEESTSFFAREKEKVDALASALRDEERGRRKRVAFFYVSSNGYVNVRKPGDYLCKMIEIAGGRYALDELELDPSRVGALSTVNVDWESFYQHAVDADVVIYNGTIGGGVATLADLFALNPLFRSFKAVKEGAVWSTSLNLYQESSRVADIVLELHDVIDGNDAAPLRYFTKVTQE